MALWHETRQREGNKGLVLSVRLDGTDVQQADEFAALVGSAGIQITQQLPCRLRKVQSKTFFGSGKVEQIRDLLADEAADMVLLNKSLSPSQNRVLEEQWQLPVIDYPTLILDIFAQRAHTHEGKLQVELAQLEHLRTRLIRGWTHLERQRGGIGLRGPGETQLETDRRLIGQRIKQLKKRLDKVRSQRHQARGARLRSRTPTVALVGYTNAGKSTLFNRLTGAKVHAADQLFATLDPTMRRASLPSGGHVILSDTVGFIQDLPPHLIEAFKATLEEVGHADLLLHVVDQDAADRAHKMQVVSDILASLKVDCIPVLVVLNKSDDPETCRNDELPASRCRVSAQYGYGCEELMHRLEHYLLASRDALN